MNDHQLVVAKVVVIVVLLLVTLIFCFLPYVLNRWYKWTERNVGNARDFLAVLCLLNFGGGVLIATTFIHILPAVVGVVDALQQCEMLATTPFALPEMLMCSGFFLMYGIEELMYFIVGRQQRKKQEILQQALEEGTDKEQQQLEQVAEPNWLRGLGIIVALSLHELFGGMSIGLEESVQNTWFMCGAIAAHKLVLAFCIGMEIMMAHTRWLIAVIYLVVFSIVTPIGVGIGIAVSETASANQPSIPAGILQGIACGTLLYVVYYEIVAKNHAGWRIFLCCLGGFVLMFGLQIAVVEAKGKGGYECPSHVANSVN
ncbi:zinc transporter ZIP1 [Drosophila sulfurigaster albostrigata]|uniref:zinc transporter ZIP1 n=1 Tax=Drosophila sulfurigaster albostrigata TaxID=89887 RepID=UPI002D219C9F|nr:zinc transporter ZIP1 [Drosophila sulfurigaster albostrigata]